MDVLIREAVRVCGLTFPSSKRDSYALILPSFMFTEGTRAFATSIKHQKVRFNTEKPGIMYWFITESKQIHEKHQLCGKEISL